MPDGIFKRAKYKKIPRKKTGIVDKVKNAFNQKSPTTPAQQSTNKAVVKNTLTNNQTTKKNPTPGSAAKPTGKPAVSSTSTSSRSTPPPPVWFNDSGGATAMNPGGNSMLQDIASGNLKTKLVSGGYEHDSKHAGGSSFVEDPTGKQFLQFEDNSGNALPGNRNASRGMNSNRSLAALSIPKEALSKDAYGQSVKTIDQVASMFADKRAQPRNTTQRRDYEQNLKQSIKNYSLANDAYRRNFDYNKTVGQIGTTASGEVPNNARTGLPTGSTWGDGSATDISQIDKLRGGTGEPFYMDNKNWMHRQGRMIPTGKLNLDGTPQTAWQYEGASKYDASNPDPHPDIPIENFYWQNPVGKTAPTTPMGGVKVQGKPWSSLTEGERDEIRKVHDDMEKKEWYRGAVHQNFKKENPELHYDYNKKEPWSLTNIGKYQGVTNASNNFSFYK